MRRMLTLVALALASPILMAGNFYSARTTPVDDQYIVVLKDEVQGARRANAAQRKARRSQRLGQMARLHRGARVKRVFNRVLNGGVMNMTEREARILARRSDVAFVEQDGLVQINGVQNGATWGLDRIDQADLPLDSTYSYDTTGLGVQVYIVDTGISVSHTEFGGRAQLAFDSIGDGQNGEDCNGHGTHVASTVGGSTYGVAKDADLFAVRVLDCDGSGTNSSVIDGVDWVTANASLPAVINMSLGGGASTALDNAVANATDAGIVVAVAAGNNNLDACGFSPARAISAITVAASTSSDVRASFSNYGSCVDVIAPGQSITGAWIGSDTATNTISGTSMASPHVAGLVARLLEADPTATPAEITAQILDSAAVDKIADAGTGTPNLLLQGDPSGASPPPPEPNVPPVAGFTYQCQGLVCTFVNTSTDSDGTIVEYFWFMGDGTIFEEPNPVHSFFEAGSYDVELWVTDNEGETSIYGEIVTVEDAPPVENEPPVADFGVSCDGLTCAFQDLSVDSDGSIVQRAWAFGDGESATAVDPSHTFAAAGDYDVELTVTDDDGATASLVQVVTVEEPDVGAIELTGTVKVKRRKFKVRLRWDGATTRRVDVYVNGYFIGRTRNDGKARVVIRRQGTYTFEICERRSDVCSNELSLELSR